LFVFFANPIIGIFTQEPAIRAVGAKALQVIGTGYIFYGIGMVMMQALNGAGDTKTPTVINFIGFWLFQIPLAWVMAKTVGMGPEGVFWAVPIAETFIAIATFWMFKRGRWKMVKV
jgi:Na+-driven multidrug efflux pump